MPKIKTVAERVDSKRVFEFEIWYNTKEKFFIKDGFPLEIRKYINEVWHSHYDQLEDLEKCIREVIKEYRINTSTNRDVIIVSIVIGQPNIDEIKHPNKHSYHGDMADRIRGYGFSFHYVIATEYGNTENNEKFYKHLFFENEKFVKSDSPVHHIRGGGRETIIPLTEENLQFCKDFSALTNEMCEKLVGFFGDKNEQHFLKAIQSGTLKALGTTKALGDGN